MPFIKKKIENMILERNEREHKQWRSDVMDKMGEHEGGDWHYQDFEHWRKTFEPTKAEKKAAKEKERKQRRRELLTKMRGEAGGKSGEEKTHESGGEEKLSEEEEAALDDLDYMYEDDSEPEEQHPTLADCRASYENCLKMNAIG